MIIIESVEKLPPSRQNKKNEEVLVCFSTVELRDLVQTYATNLSKAEGNAGMRLEIPPFLHNDFKVLEAHGNELRRRYGRDGDPVCRSIKYEDSERGLVKDIKMPGNEEWQRVHPWQARQAKNLRTNSIKDTSGNNASDRRFLLLPSPVKGGNTTGRQRSSSTNAAGIPSSRAVIEEDNESLPE